MTPWTVACETPLSMGFCRQEYWSGLPFPSPGDPPNPGTEPGSPALQADSLPTELWGRLNDLSLLHRFCLIQSTVDTVCWVLFLFCFFTSFFLYYSAPDFIWFFFWFTYLCWTSHFVCVLFSWFRRTSRFPQEFSHSWVIVKSGILLREDDINRKLLFSLIGDVTRTSIF